MNILRKFDCLFQEFKQIYICQFSSSDNVDYNTCCRIDGFFLSHGISHILDFDMQDEIINQEEDDIKKY